MDNGANSPCHNVNYWDLERALDFHLRTFWPSRHVCFVSGHGPYAQFVLGVAAVCLWLCAIFADTWKQCGSSSKTPKEILLQSTSTHSDLTNLACSQGSAASLNWREWQLTLWVWTMPYTCAGISLCPMPLRNMFKFLLCWSSIWRLQICWMLTALSLASWQFRTIPAMFWLPKLAKWHSYMYSFVNFTMSRGHLCSTWHPKPILSSTACSLQGISTPRLFGASKVKSTWRKPRKFSRAA